MPLHRHHNIVKAIKAATETMGRSAYVPHNYPIDEVEPGLDETAFYDPKNFTFPSGAYVCEVEIDRDTGIVQIANFACVDDFGRIGFRRRPSGAP